MSLCCVLTKTEVDGSSFCSLFNLSVSERILARDPLDEIKKAFQLFDDDHTGKIGLRNLRRVARDLGDKLDDEELCVAAYSLAYDWL